MMLELAIATDFAGEATKLELLEEEMKGIAEAGFTHVHWCNEWDGDYIYSVYEMQQIREWLNKYHLKAKSLHATKGSRRNVNCVSGHYRKDYTSDWEYNRKAGVELIKNRVDLAACLGATEIVLHLYLPFMTIQHDETVKDNIFCQIKKSFDELQPYCIEKGVRICVENLFDMPAEYTLYTWDWLIEHYPPEFLGFCFDSGHANMIWGENMCDIIRKYGSRIYSVHLHDNYQAVDSHMLPKEGDINWEAVITALAESAYELPLILELSCDRDNVEEFLQEAYKRGAWLNEIYQNHLTKM